MNPCPCGNLGHPHKACTCSPAQINRYQSRISGPLLDRIDLTVNLNPIKYEDWSKASEGEKSAQIKAFCPLPPGADAVLETAMRKLGLSARSLDKILKTARTIADLEGKDHLETRHIIEVMQYRPLDRKGVADV